MRPALRIASESILLLTVLLGRDASPLGTYKWLVNVANEWGSNQGSITVNITAVPEPATIVILALATPLLVGCRRR